MENVKKDTKINVPTKNNKVLQEVLDRINQNEEIYTLWKVNNVNAIERLGMTDHGPVHFQIVANIALRLSRILHKNDVEFGIVKNFGMDYDYAEVVIFLASVMHDLGISISRDGHEEFSLILTNTILREMLDFMSIEERTIVTSETLHAIISHRSGGSPYTVEAGIVRVSDALDMSEGRSRIPYTEGKTDIHSISAAAINNIEISEGDDRPILIQVDMNNSAGVFQVDELLKRKIRGSGLEKYLTIRAFINSEHEKKLVKTFDVAGF